VIGYLNKLKTIQMINFPVQIDSFKFIGHGGQTQCHQLKIPENVFMLKSHNFVYKTKKTLDFSKSPQ
jgi:hypothetical protein